MYSRNFESEDTQRKRLFMQLWSEVTMLQKEARADKEAEMLALTRRNNFKMKTEVKGIMNLVIFDAWRNWAWRKKYRREELQRIKEEEDAAKLAERKEEEAMRRKQQRLDTSNNGRSFKAQGTGLGALEKQGSLVGASINVGGRPSSRGDAGGGNEEKPETVVSPKPPAAKKADKSVVSPVAMRSTAPLSEKQAACVKRLSNPPNYIPVYLRHDAGDSNNRPTDKFGNHTFMLNEGDDDVSGVFSTDSFENTLAKMYALHRKKIRDTKEKKAVDAEKKAKAKMAAKSEKTVELTEEEKRRRQLQIEEQKRLTDRLYQGLGGGKKESEELGTPPQHDEHGRRVSQRGAGRKLKKSVIMESLKKEKHAMLDFLERLQMPLTGLSQTH
jgi:hypothetical protein